MRAIKEQLIECIQLRYGLGIVGETITRDQAREKAAELMEIGAIPLANEEGVSEHYPLQGVCLVDDPELPGVGSLVGWIKRPTYDTRAIPIIRE